LGILCTVAQRVVIERSAFAPAIKVVLVALPGVDLEAVEAEVERQCRSLPRGDIARQALSHSGIVEVETREEAAAFSNRYAPEHLIVNVEVSHVECLPC
jgi:histidinol dehydrogenase